MPVHETRKLRLKTSRVTTVVSDEMMALGFDGTNMTNTIGCTSTITVENTYGGCAADPQK